MLYLLGIKTIRRKKINSSYFWCITHNTLTKDAYDDYDVWVVKMIYRSYKLKNIFYFIAGNKNYIK